jgi:hypothetical protein
MPKPIICLSDTLRQFLEDFRSCFSRRQWPYFVIVLLGLVECKERSTLTGFLRCVAETASLCGLSRFLSRWSWSAKEVVEIWLGRFRQQMEPEVQAEHFRQRAARPKRQARPKATLVTGYLIFDDSVHCKPNWVMFGAAFNPSISVISWCGSKSSFVLARLLTKCVPN